MKTSMTLEGLRNEVIRQATTREDYVVPQDAISYNVYGGGAETIAFQGRSFPLTTLGHRQMAAILRIPFGFYERMRRDHADLHHLEVNRLLAETAKPRMIRTLDGNARAVLSNRFLRVDGDALLEILLNELTGLGLQVESAHVDHERMYVKAFSPELEGEIAWGDAVRGGFIFSTSEVGLGRIWISSMLYRVSTGTGLIVGSTLGTYKRRHVGPTVMADEETGLAMAEVAPSFSKMVEDIQGSIRVALAEPSFRTLLEQLRATRIMAIPAGLDLEDLMVRMRRRLGLLDHEASAILALLRTEEQSAFGLMQAILRYSQEAKTYERATELEEMGGAIMALTPREWTHLTEPSAVSPAA